MSYELARNQIVTIVEGTTLTKPSIVGLGPKFTKRLANVQGQQARAGRSFNLWSTQSSVVGSYHRAVREYIHEMEIAIFYPQLADHDLLDLVMETDRQDLCLRLTDVDTWGTRATNGIVNISVFGERFFPAQRRQQPTGWEMVQMIQLHHR